MYIINLLLNFFYSYTIFTDCKMLKDSFNYLSAQNIIPSYLPNSVSWNLYPKYTINLNNSKTIRSNSNKKDLFKKNPSD